MFSFNNFNQPPLGNFNTVPSWKQYTGNAGEPSNTIGDQMAEKMQSRQEQVDPQVQEVVDFRNQLKESGQDTDEMVPKEMLLKALADHENYRKRAEATIQQCSLIANEHLIVREGIISIRENLRRAANSPQSDTEGLLMILQSFDELLMKCGITVFGEVGDQFNPEYHDALSTTTSNIVATNCIAEVYEQGYMLGDKVLKHARVEVSSGLPSA